MINISLGRPRWLTIQQIAIILVMQAVFLLQGVTPALTLRLSHFYYGMTMLALAMVVQCSSPDHIEFSLCCAYTYRLISSMGNLNICSAIFWNMVGTGGTILHVCYHTQQGDSMGTIIMIEVSTTVIIIAAVFAFKQWTLAGIHQEIQFGILKSENSASMSLLDMVCDVVVELSSDMKIVQDSRAMAALLMRSSGTSVAGRPFCDFLPDDADRRSLAECLSALGTGPEAAVGSCRVHLSDSLGNRVGAEIFHVRVTIHDDEYRYILGIREFSDAIPDFPPFQHAARRVPAQQHQQRGPARKGTPPAPAQASLQARDPPAALAIEAPARRADCRRFPSLVETRGDIPCKDIVFAMNHWNMRAPRTMCCPFHAYVADLKAMVRHTLSQLPCVAEFPDPVYWRLQCQSCGSIYDDVDIPSCDACGSEDLGKLPQPVEVA